MMEWWQMALGIVCGGIALFALIIFLKFLVTFIVLLRMTPMEYKLWKIQHGIFDEE